MPSSSSFTSFAPSLPSLPSYPSSASSGHAAKRRPRRQPNNLYSNNNSYYSPYPPTPLGSDDDPYDGYNDGEEEEEDALDGSTYSDAGYRSSLVLPTPDASTTTSSASRKRTYRDTFNGDNAAEGRIQEPPTPPGKRRILELVGGAVRGVWSIITKPIPFIGSSTSSSSGPSCLPTSAPYGVPSPPATPTSYQQQQQQQQHHHHNTISPPPVSVQVLSRSGQTLTPLESDLDIGLRMMAQRRREMEEEMQQLDTHISQRWIMVPPPPPPLNTQRGLTPHRRSNTWSSGSSPATHTHAVGTRRTRMRKPATARHSIGSTPPAWKRRSTSGSTLSSPTFPTSSATPLRRRVTSSSTLDNHSRMDPAEREMDQDMKRLNDNLKKLIKEGREALGAKVEVVYDDDEDEDLDLDLDFGFRGGMRGLESEDDDGLDYDMGGNYRF